MEDTPSDDNSNAPIVAPKQKRQLTEKQKEILAKGREKGKEQLRLKREQAKKEKQELIEQLAIKKANNLIKKKVGLKKDFDLEDADEDEEDIIIPIQPKKPKKKQIVYLPPESESEEEIVYKRAPAGRRPVKQELPPPEPAPAPVNRHRVVFY
jgi:cell division protein FtsL